MSCTIGEGQESLSSRVERACEESAGELQTFASSVARLSHSFEEAKQNVGQALLKGTVSSVSDSQLMTFMTSHGQSQSRFTEWLGQVEDLAVPNLLAEILVELARLKGFTALPCFFVNWTLAYDEPLWLAACGRDVGVAQGVLGMYNLAGWTEEEERERQECRAWMKDGIVIEAMECVGIKTETLYSKLVALVEQLKALDWDFDESG